MDFLPLTVWLLLISTKGIVFCHSAYIMSENEV